MLPFVLESDDPKEASSDAFNLPKDVVIDILKRLPLKSLIRLTSVSKSWLSLITSPSLISSHVSHNLTITTSNGEPKDHVFKETFYEQVLSSNTYFFILDRYLSYNRDRINCPVGKNHFIVASSDGLFCLFDFQSEYPQIEPLILWNPSIRKTLIVLPPSDAAFVNKLIFGFGYDSLSSSYKLVRVAYFNSTGLATGTFFKTQIYDLDHKKWRSLDVASMSFTVSSIKGRGLYMNGVIHWVCNLNASVSCSILTFNMGSEGFGEIKLPKEVGEAINQTVKVVMVPKSSKEVFGVIHHTVSLELNVWVMEQYGVEESWVKLFNTETETMIMNDINVAVLNDELVIYQLSSYAWISYNVRTKETRNITHWFWGRDYVDTYVESLLLLR